MDLIEEIKKYEQEAEKLKSAYAQCIGVVAYLKNQLEEQDKKKDKKE